jgi:hypothetical protein
MSQKQYKPHFEHLKNKWQDKRRALNKSLWEKHKESLDWIHQTSKQFMAGSVASLILLSHPAPSNIIAQNILPPDSNDPPKEQKIHRTKNDLIHELTPLLPQEVVPLSSEQEQIISEKLSSFFTLRVFPELQGKRLNRSYGYIGAEQHLMRYPGDTMDTHFATAEEAIYAASGMAPGRGAWGYFTDSASSMNAGDIAREKYYIAVPTFLAPGWNENVSDYYAFFKYRKMLVVNAENGKAMVVVIGDAGPAEFTGKHLGGSPEVMSYLERHDGGQKGPVLYFFIDDPENKIPLGPIEVQ